MDSLDQPRLPKLRWGIIGMYLYLDCHVTTFFLMGVHDMQVPA